jgi:hypothetical protein
MTRILVPTLLIGTPALAHDGLHLHPHGVEYGWIIACVLGALAGLALARLRGWK